MADIVANNMSATSYASLTPGQTLQVQILNADGSVSSTVYSGTVPFASTTFSATVYIAGTLS